MLDQNTDRMWYVIGAVLIGAAIIFGFNTFIPNAFASVGSSFETLSSKVGLTEGVPLELKDPDFKEFGRGWHDRYAEVTYDGEYVYASPGADVFLPLDVSEGETIRVKFRAKGVGSMKVRFGVSAGSEMIEPEVVSLTDEFKTYTVYVDRVTPMNHYLIFLTDGEASEFVMDWVDIVNISRDPA